MWPSNAFHTSNVTSENHRGAQSNNCPTNEIINPAFASLQQSWQQQAAQASAMPSANTPLSNMHSRFTPSHPGSSLVTHPASVQRVPWEYPSPFAAQHQIMQHSFQDLLEQLAGTNSADQFPLSPFPFQCSHGVSSSSIVA